MPSDIAVTYLFDPLCGWCYGASEGIKALAARPGIHVTPMPTGLFSGPGALPMSADFAAYAWSNDQRIAKLTGRPFSDAYRRDVLGHKGGRFDSGRATLALTFVHRARPDLELDYLRAIQRARFVEGRDVTDLAVLGAVAASFGLDGAALADQVADDAALLGETRARVEVAQETMARYGLQGVPAAIAHLPAGDRLLDMGEIMRDPSRAGAGLAAAE